MLMPSDDLNKRSDRDIINELLPEYDCEYVDDALWFKEAMETKDLFVCNCIIDAEHKGICKEKVIDSLIYTRALRTYDETLCEEITDESTAEICKEATLGLIEYADFDSNPSQEAYIDSKALNFDDAIVILEEKITEVEGKDAVSDLLLLSITYANSYLFEHKLNNLEKAFAAVAKAELIVPNEPEVYRVKGFVYEVQPDLDKAIENYSKAIDLSPNYLLTYINRGHAYNKAGRLYMAVDDFEKASELDVNKEYAELYVQMCRLYATNSEFTEKAIENCLFAYDNFKVRLNSDELSGTQLVLGNLYFRAGRFEEALDRFKIALTIYPKSTDTLSWIARVHNAKSNFEEAENYARKAIAINPVKTTAHKELGIALLNQGKYDEAIEISLKGLEYVAGDASLLIPSKDTNIKILYYILSDAYASKGNNAKANEYKQLGDALK